MMTADVIIKALECCNSNERGSCLNKCPYYKHSATCTQSMIVDTLDLINRQKTEIERLQKAIEVQNIMIEQQDYKLKTAKAEAINEFAEGFKNLTASYWLDNINKGHIDNLVKEMVGDDK